MHSSKTLFLAALLASAQLLTACGGGGGGDSGGATATALATTVPATPTSAGVVPASPAVSSVTTGTTGSTAGSTTVSGNVSFDSVPNTAGPLVYGATVSKPVRGAPVELVSRNQSVLASATTDAGGNYAITVPQGQQVFVRVRAALKQSGSGATWDVSVRDNTQNDGLYALESAAFQTSGVSLKKDLHAASGWNGTGYTSLRAAGPFAILDTVYRAQAKVLSVAPATAFPALLLMWSQNNVPADGSTTLGQIGGTQFLTESRGPVIYVLGKAEVDTDEYDESVVAHEWGHYYQASFSRDDSPGGDHAPGDLLDRRVAFSEGWGDGWSGIALGRSNYTDSYDAGQQGGFQGNLAAGASSLKGWFNEDSIAYVLWKLNQLLGFKPIHDAMTGPLKAGTPVTSVHAFNAALKTVSASAATSFAGLLASEGIDATTDAWGSTEANSGGSAVALPMYRVLAPGVPLGNVCVSNALGAGLGDNKLGNYAYLRFVVRSAKTYQIEVAGGSLSTDPHFSVHNASGIVADASLTSTGSESKSVPLAAGEYVLAVTDYQNKSALTCFTVSVN